MAVAKELKGRGGIVDFEQVQAEENKAIGKFVMDLKVRFLIHVSGITCK